MMNLPWTTIATFGLLAIAICAVWLKPVQLSERLSVPPWGMIFLASIAMGYFAGHLAWQAILSLAAFVAVAYTASTTTHHVLRVFTRVLTGLMVLALYMNLFPGFMDATLVKDMVVSEGTKPFTHHAKFGPISTGLILLAFFCNPIRTGADWKTLVRQVAPVIGLALVCVLGLGLILGYLKFDFKIGPYTGTYFIVNLLFTCVAEEAFFRGFLQEQLTRAMSRWRFGAYLAMCIGVLLFGIAHVRGGPTLVLLATIAGGFYAAAYVKTKRVEASILTHFALNAVHFLAFTYPGLQPSLR